MTTGTHFDSSILIRLLDHQITDDDGRFLGKVDDLALREEGGELVVDALMVGPTALAPRYPGVLGRWGWAIWRRLSDASDPGAVLVPLEEVTGISADVRVTDGARDALLASFGLENWLRKHLVARIPGASGAGHPTSDDVDVPAWAGRERRPVPELGSTGDRHRLTELLRAQVVAADGSVRGRITDVEGRSGSGDDRVGPIRLTRVLVGPRSVGSSLGYSTAEQTGPLAINRLIRTVHRRAEWSDWSAVEDVDWVRGRVLLR